MQGITREVPENFNKNLIHIEIKTSEDGQSITHQCTGEVNAVLSALAAFIVTISHDIAVKTGNPSIFRPSLQNFCNELIRIADSKEQTEGILGRESQCHK